MTEITEIKWQEAKVVEFQKDMEHRENGVCQMDNQSANDNIRRNDNICI